MRLKQLNQKHCNYDKSMYDEYNALYEGGKVFERLKERFLKKSDFEPLSIYQMKKDNAEYQNFVGPIIDQLAAQLFATPFKLVINPEPSDSFYNDFQNDCDGGGKDLVNFSQDLFISAVVKGSGWFVAELPSLTPELMLAKQQGKLSIDQEDALGARRVTLCPVDNGQVFDWGVDEYGDFLWVCIYKCEHQRINPFLDSGDMVKETWKIYDNENVTTFSLTRKSDECKPETLELAPSSVIKHGFSKIPVMRLQFPAGLFIMNRVFSAQAGHFRTAAQLDWAQRNCAYPMPVFKTKDKDNPPVLGAGRWIMINENEDFQMVSPDPGAFKTLLDRLESKRVEIYRVTQQMAAGISNSSVIGRSADSKAIDLSATEICLRSYGRFIKELIENIFDLIKNARNEDLEFSVEGMEQFSQEDLKLTIESLKAAKEMVVHSPLFNEQVEHKIIDLSFPNIDTKIKAQMHQEVTDLAKQDLENADDEAEQVEDIDTNED